MKPNNPFLTSGYHGPEYFCEPGTESGKIIDALCCGRDVCLISPRGMGSTGVVKHVYHLLQESDPDILTLHMNIESSRNMKDFAQSLAGTVLGQFEENPLEALEKISKSISSCHPHITFDELSGKLKANVNIESLMAELLLKETFEYIQSSGRRCHITIDGFHQIKNYPEEDFEETLHSYIKSTPSCYFIYGSSREDLMNEIFLSPNRPFFQSAERVILKGVEREAYYEFACGFFAAQGRELPRDVFDFIYGRYEGMAWYMQRILNRLYGYSGEIDVRMARFAISEIIEENSYAYKSIVKAYTAGNVELMKAIAKSGYVKEVMQGDFITKNQLKAASSVSSAIRKLVNNGIVRKSSAGYSLSDRFMSEWLASQA